MIGEAINAIRGSNEAVEEAWKTVLNEFRARRKAGEVEW